ncbi:hypothetical protein [Methylobacterium aquaticum]|uniref:hypothetical protein n=1 Tax=Methylobacterium aquaticum TaxID=270351 RepID=UPI00193194B0|nr:hypothetical protein [Methylobacterium aquaticum]QRE72555.1 hypothetical protein F1D61_01580 [Methylobacterium aquaticum]
MTTIFFGPPGAAQAAPGVGQGGVGQGGLGKGSLGKGSARPVASVCCSAVVICHLVDRRRVTKP